MTVSSCSSPTATNDFEARTQSAGEPGAEDNVRCNAFPVAAPVQREGWGGGHSPGSVSGETT